MRRRWVIAIVVVCVIAGLIAFARGRSHHHGDDVGSGALGRVGTAEVITSLSAVSGREEVSL